MLRPFSRFCVTIGAIPESIIKSMSYEEQLIRLIKFLKCVVIPAIDGNTKAIKEIEDWINNINLQDEVNNKLDEMSESGQLQEIISLYLNSKAIFVFDSVEDMKNANNLIVGSNAKTLGFYNQYDKGGALYKIAEETTEDNNMDYIKLNNGLVAVYQYDKELNIKQIGAKGDGTDDSTVFKYAFDNYNNIFIPNGTYLINDTVEFNNETQVKGESMTETILKSSQLLPIFVFKSDVHTGKWNIKSNIKFENFKTECKNFMQINDDTLPSSSWVNQASILGATFKNIWAYGTYETATDSNRETSNKPTLEELKNFGLGFNFSSVFDARFEQCRIESFGLGIYLKGCDINVITNNRINKNGVHVYLDRIDTYGSQTTISNNDMLKNQRYGAITINGTRQDAVINNYFEEYSASGCFVYSNNDISTLIDGNRIDNPKVDGISVFDLSPIIGDIIVNNRVGPNLSYRTFIDVKPTNYSGISNAMRYLAIIKNNVDALYIKNYALCLTERYNPLVVSPFSMKIEENYPDGQYWASPWVVEDIENNTYGFNNTATGVVRFNFKNLKSNYRKPVKVRIYYRSSERTSLYTVIRCDGTDKRSTTDTIINDNAIHYYDIELSDTTIYDYVRVTVNTYPTMFIYAVELI